MSAADAPSRARQRLKTRDVLVSMIRPNLNAVAILPSELDGAIGSTGFDVLRTRWVDPSWLLYFVQTDDFVRAMSRLVQGVLYPAVRPKDIRSYRLPLAPPSEQRRIVAEIEKQFTRLDAAVAALKRVQANLKRYRAAVLKAAVEGRLVPTEAELARREGRSYEPASELLKRILAERRARWEAAQFAKFRAAGKEAADERRKSKYKDPLEPEADNLPILPGGWRWVSLDFLLCSIEAGKNFKCDEHPPGAGEVGVVRVSAVTWGEFDELETKTCPDPLLVGERHIIRPGDFLFSRANTIELVGACVIVKEVHGRHMLSDKILRLNLVDIPKTWVLYSLRSELGRNDIQRLSTGNQESMRNIGQDRIRRIRIPLPPLGEIGRICEEVNRRLPVADELGAQVEANLKRAERLRQAILKRAFEGKLVPQDPNDEPASVLLERIRAERRQSAIIRPKREKRGRPLNAQRGPGHDT
jgi:type I restriction enzyme S subunit